MLGYVIFENLLLITLLLHEGPLKQSFFKRIFFSCEARLKLGLFHKTGGLNSCSHKSGNNQRPTQTKRHCLKTLVLVQNFISVHHLLNCAPGTFIQTSSVSACKGQTMEGVWWRPPYWHLQTDLYLLRVVKDEPERRQPAWDKKTSIEQEKKLNMRLELFKHFQHLRGRWKDKATSCV